MLQLLTFSSSSSCSVFLTTSFFTALLSLPKSTGVVSNFSISSWFTLRFKLLKSPGTFFNLSLYLIYLYVILNKSYFLGFRF